MPILGGLLIVVRLSLRFRFVIHPKLPTTCLEVKSADGMRAHRLMVETRRWKLKLRDAGTGVGNLLWQFRTFQQYRLVSDRIKQIVELYTTSGEK